MPDKNMQRRSFFAYLVGIPAAVTALVAVADVPVVAKPLVAEPPKPIPAPKLPEPEWPKFKNEDIIRNAFTLAGILSLYETPSAEDYALATAVLEALVDEWKMERITIFPSFLSTALANRLMVYYGMIPSPHTLALERTQVEACQRYRDHHYAA